MDIEKIARECGLVLRDYEWIDENCGDGIETDYLKRFADAIRREALLEAVQTLEKIRESADAINDTYTEAGAEYCADAIRALIEAPKP